MSTFGVLDLILTVAGIGVLISRQFLWRSADGLFKLPVYVMIGGAVMVAWDIASGVGVGLVTLVAACVEMVLVFGTGSVMGAVSQIRSGDGDVRYRLPSWGVLLWAVFLAVRVASFFVAGRAGAHLLDTSGAIMFYFGVNRLANAFVIRNRLQPDGRDQRDTSSSITSASSSP